MNRLLVATGNAGKLREVRAILEDVQVEVLCLKDFPPIDSPEETESTFSGNAALKATYYSKHAGCVALADDSEQIVGVGLNCTAPEYATDLLKSAVGINTPLVVYPNSGEQWNPDGNQWTGEQCATMPLEDWYDTGARLIGGCCRTSIDEIASMRTRLTAHVSELHRS